ncbi:MAG: nucleotide sugar dehydrogenase [Nanoarchaeota archaeon]|nr:nucleotide sugar dehydrogenase [Nanoarchaeota archaeon]MBU1103191.1 nucleotide sugar dehydrogenase [Nanoarchaeota archaeon]
MKIGILGVGIVGSATAKVFGKANEVFPYDRYKTEYNSQVQLSNLVANSEVIFICVPTPMKKSGEMDYSAIYDSLEKIKKESESQGKNPAEIIIVIRSTAVSGTTDKFAEQFPFRFAFNPEFLTEKNAIKDMEETDRVVLGVSDEQTKQKLYELYKALFPNAKYVFVDRKTAEMIKYAANVTLASQIAVANELYQICQKLRIDYETVKQTILLDNRIGTNISVPGHDGDFGFGGKCFPKDLNALIYLAREHGYRPHLFESVWMLNEKLRKNKDWLGIPGAVSENKDFSENVKQTL